jgi:hypothetical protein
MKAPLAYFLLIPIEKGKGEEYMRKLKKKRVEK